jgi:hypothetical protein
MQDSGLHHLISTVATDGALLSMLQDNPRAFAERMGLGETAAAALESADTVLKLDVNPLSAITLTGTVTTTHTISSTKCYARTRDFDQRIVPERLTKKDLLRVLEISLKDPRFAARLKADMGL